MGDGLVKIAIPLRGPRWTVETVWAEPLGGDRYRIQNIPWLADGFHNRDIVRCKPAEGESMPEVVEVVEPSGHDTLHLVFTQRASNELRNEVLERMERDLGFIERAGDDGWAVDVNPGTDRDAALAYLGALQADGFLEA
jgi:hypothetical protein